MIMAMEEQKEEFEVLDAIYGEDPRFTAINEIKFQYRFGEDGEPNSFVLDIDWPEDYPCVLPKFGLDAFYNNLMPQGLKKYLLKAIEEESEKYVGSVQTYTILEWIRENTEVMFIMAEKRQLLEPKKAPTEGKETEEEDKDTNPGASPKKKEQLTKSQKRRDWERKDGKGETARGGDWVDIVKHLSQTGGHQDDPDTKT